jgi:Tetratricopeptide repeat
MAALGDRQLVAVGELSEWREDVAGGVGPAIVLLEVPREWGRTRVLDWLAEQAEPDAADQVTFLFRVPGSDLSEERGSQANEICGFLADAATQHPAAKALGLDRLAGVAVLGLGVGGLAVTGFGALAAMLAGQEAITAAGNLRAASTGGQIDALARLARSAAQLSAQVPVVVLIDDADDLDLDLALLLLENLTFRDGGRMLIVAAADPDGPLATALRKGGRAWQAGRVFVVDVDPDMGPQSRVALARELCPGLDDVLARRIGQRTATFKDVFAVAEATARAAQLSTVGDHAGALTAIDAAIDAVMRGPDPSPAAVMVAWAGGVVHARQVARVPADAGQAGLAGDPDLASSGEGHGPVIRLADPASPRFAAPVARLEPQAREMAAAVLQEAVIIRADRAEPLVGRIVAGRAVHHVRRDLDEDTDPHLLLSVQRGLVADLEAVGDLAPAAKVAAEALEDCPAGDRYEQDRQELKAAVLRLASTRSAGEQDPLVARLIGEAISGGAAVGVEARVWAAVNLLGMPGRTAPTLDLIDQITTELSAGGDLGELEVTWRLLLAFHAGRAGYPSAAQALLAPLLISPDVAVQDAASRVLRAIDVRHADARLQIEALEAALTAAQSDDDLLRLHAALASAYREVGDYRHALGHSQMEVPLRQSLQGQEHPSTLNARHYLAYDTGRAGDAAGARDQYATLLPVRERVLGPEHPNTLTTRSQLARWTGEAGDPASARDQYATLLPIRERVLGPEHVDTLAIRAGLARWTGNAGDVAGARDQFAAQLRIRERVQGPEHRETLSIRHNLAYDTGRAGDAAGARDQFAVLLPIREHVLGPEHPDTLITRRQLARWTGEAGDPAGARDQFAALLPIHERDLGPEHPDTLSALGSLARWSGQAGDVAGARDQFAVLVRIFARVLGPEHPETLVTHLNLASLTGLAGDAAGARDQFAALMPIHERVLGPEHPQTLATRSSLAYWAGQAGR